MPLESRNFQDSRTTPLSWRFRLAVAGRALHALLPSAAQMAGMWTAGLLLSTPALASLTAAHHVPR